MSGIESAGVSNAHNAYGIPGVKANGGFVHLSPELLLEFCDKRLKEIDRQVGDVFRAQDAMNGDAEVLGDLASTLSERNNIAKAKDPKTATEIIEAFDKAILQAQSPDLKKDLAEQLAAFRGGVNAPEANDQPGQAHIEAIADAGNRVTTLQKDISNDSQLNMVMLQELVSKRQQALMMCTNLMASLSEAAKAVAQNIGR